MGFFVYDGVMANLTPKQEAFCLAYLETGNASEAYRRSYDAKNMTDKSINEKASQILSQVKIRSRIDQLSESAVTSAVMTRTEALERLSLVASVDITDVVEFNTTSIDTEDGPQDTTIWRIKESSELERAAKAAIKSVTMTKFGPKIEMHDKLNAIQQLAKMQGWEAAQKFDHTSSDGSMTPPTRIELVPLLPKE